MQKESVGFIACAFSLCGMDKFAFDFVIAFDFNIALAHTSLILSLKAKGAAALAAPLLLNCNCLHVLDAGVLAAIRTKEEGRGNLHAAMRTGAS